MGGPRWERILLANQQLCFKGQLLIFYGHLIMSHYLALIFTHTWHRWWVDKLTIIFSTVQLALQHDNHTMYMTSWRGGLWAAQVHESLIRPTMGLVLLLQGTAFDWVKVRLGFFANFPHPRRWHSKCNYFSYRDVSIHFCMAADIFWNCLINTVPSLVCCNDLEACEQLSIMRGYNLLLTASNTRYPCLSKQQNPASFLNP